MTYDWRKTLTKAATRIAVSAGLVAVAVGSDYMNSGEIPTRFLLFVPFAHGALAAAANWLKHREDV